MSSVFTLAEAPLTSSLLLRSFRLDGARVAGTLLDLHRHVPHILPWGSGLCACGGSAGSEVAPYLLTFCLWGSTQTYVGGVCTSDLTFCSHGNGQSLDCLWEWERFVKLAATSVLRRCGCLMLEVSWLHWWVRVELGVQIEFGDEPSLTQTQTSLVCRARVKPGASAKNSDPHDVAHRRKDLT